MDIKKTVHKLIKQYGTSDPFRIAEQIGVLVTYTNLYKIQGMFLYWNRQRCIILDENISDDITMRTVMAHELGHAVLHKKGICYYVGGITLNLKDKNEIEANTFAAELLIPDSVIKDNADMTIEQLSALSGINKKLFEFKR